MSSGTSRSPIRLLRTEVIWTNDADDPCDEDGCPVNFDLCKRRKSALVACLCFGLVIVTTASSINRDLRTESRWKSSIIDRGPTNETYALGWTDGSDVVFGTTVPRGDGIDSMDASRRTDFPLPTAFDQNLADVDEPLRAGDIPYFFHAPRTAGQTIKDILGICVGLNTTRLTATIEGINAAKDLGLIKNEKPDVIVTQYLHAGAMLFNRHHRGRMFTIVRHPIERAVSMYYYLPKANYEPTNDPDLGHTSIEVWSRSKRTKHNWMTRFLSNELEGILTSQHLDISKEVLRKKCIIGLIDEKTESWLRLERFFGWKFYKQKNHCLDRLLNWGWSNRNAHPAVAEGSVEWDLLYKQNELDMELYDYARQLFEEQRALFGERGSLVKRKGHGSG